MIVGSIYLGKKARKAYRNHQAEKAAQRLTHPFDIADPSDELKLKVPNSSPTGSHISLSSTPDTNSPTTTRSETATLESSRSLDQQPGSSSPTDLSRSGFEAKSATSIQPEFQHFIRRHEPTSYRPPAGLGDSDEGPPSYDFAIGSVQSSHPQHGVVDLSPHSATAVISPASAHAAWSPNHEHRHCAACIAIMQEHRRHAHGHHFHHLPSQQPSSVMSTTTPSHPGSPRRQPLPEMPAPGTTAVEMPVSVSMPAEMPSSPPALSPGSSRAPQMAELPDMASLMSYQAGPVDAYDMMMVELPADVPEDSKEEDKNEGQSVELEGSSRVDEGGGTMPHFPTCELPAGSTTDATTAS